jgi:hypothetical protein
VAFPGTKLDRTVQIALAADLTADPSTWAWTNASTYVREASPITITRGGFDGQVQSPPSSCTFVVDNRDGRWVPTNPNGAWYGQLGKGTPVRVLVDEGTESVRWTGFLTSLPPRWNTKETDRYVTVQASGIMQRLQRGQAPLRSALVRAITGTDSPPVAYWPGEDGGQATEIAEFYGGKPMQTTGQVVTFASANPAGSNPLPEFTTVAGAIGTVPTHPATGAWSVAKVYNFPASPSAETILFQWFTSGTYPQWRITLTPGSPDTIAIQAFDTSLTMQINESITYQIDGVEPHGQWLMLIVSAVQNGADVDYQFATYDGFSNGTGGVDTTEAGITAGIVTSVQEHANAKTNGMHAGHWAVWDSHIDPFLFSLDPNSISGFTGEEAGVRVQRLALEAGIRLGQFGIDLTNLMGPQTQDTFLNLLRECEAVNGGRLTEHLDPAFADNFLKFISGADYIANADAVLTLNHDSGHLAPDFEPTDDDQNLINDVTATRSGSSGTGSAARVVADSGSLKPSDVGTYNDSVTVNVLSDTDLINQAGWRVNIGTHEGMRFPVVTLDFARSPSLIADWIECDIGSRITITNPPTGIAPDDIDLLIEGWTEVIAHKTWLVQLNCSPYGPWHVFQLAETSSDTDPYLGRLAGDENCSLRIGIDDNDLSMDVDPNRHRWTTTADDFPVNVRLGGEVVTVSSIATGGVSFVAVGAASHADNSAVSPALYAGHTVDHVIFVVAAIRSSGTGTLATPTDYTRLPIFRSTDNVQVFAKVHDGSESNPTVTPAGGSAGDTVSAFTFGLGNAPITLAALGDIVVDSVVQLNASAANIAYGGLYSWNVAGCIQLIIAWKQDDYTSIAVPAGFTEMIEASSATGSDQSLYCAYRIDTTPAVVNGSSLVVTGGASAISRSAVVALAGGKQVFTLSARSVNGVTKSHAVGTKVAVDDPAVLAL